MINPAQNGNALSLSVAIAESLTHNRRVLLPRFPDSPVTTMQRNLQPTVMDLQAGPTDLLTEEARAEVVAKFVDYNSSADQLVTSEFNDLVNLVTGGVRATLVTAREVVTPLISRGVEFINGAPDGSISSNISISDQAYHPFHADAANYFMEAYAQVPLASEYKSVLIRPEQLVGWREAVLANNGFFSAESLAEVMEIMTDDHLCDVVQALFSNTNIQIKDSILFNARYFYNLNSRLLGVLVVGWLESNPVDGSGLSLEEWATTFRRLKNLASIALMRSYRSRAEDRAKGRLLLDSSRMEGEFGEVSLYVTVNPDLYGSWLADGDANLKVESLLGATVDQRRFSLISQIDESRDVLVKAWNAHVAQYQQTWTSNKIRRTRNALRAFVSTLEAVPEDVRSRVARPANWKDALENSLLQVDYALTQRPWSMLSKVLCDVYFQGTQLHAFMTSMEEIGMTRPTASPREVAAIAAGKMLALWLTGQVSVFTFDPEAPDDKNY